MKKKNFRLLIVLLFMVLGVGMAAPAPKAEAAANVMSSKKAGPGKWVISSKGRRYRFNSTGKYAKSMWRKIGGEIYYFKSDGYVQTKWKTYNGKRYYFASDGALVTGWKKLSSGKYYFWKTKGYAATGKVKIASKYYYFNSKGVMQTGWKKIGSYYYYFRPSNGSMAVSTTIGSYKVDKNGRRIVKKTTTTTPTVKVSTGKVDYWVGDSRTVGMAVTIDQKTYGSQITSGKWIAKVGQGYSWYVKTAEAKLKAALKKKPTATVVINFGVNDVSNISKYITKYKALIKAYPKANIYFMSVNPIDSKYTAGYVSNAKIKTFNTKLKNAFPTKYIDCYSYLIKNGYSTVDGLHYTAATYKKIYSYVSSKV